MPTRSVLFLDVGAIYLNSKVLQGCVTFPQTVLGAAIVSGCTFLGAPLVYKLRPLGGIAK